jgi:hypothetical protein
LPIAPSNESTRGRESERDGTDARMRKEEDARVAMINGKKQNKKILRLIA